MKIKSAIILLMSLFITQLTTAEVRLPKIIGSNMVLQRNAECKIWGWADRGEKVTVSFRDFEGSTQADKNGKWQITLPAMKEGGPYQMSITGKNRITLENILIGDIWVCSGQSNMEWPVSRAVNADEEIAAADYPEIRLFTAARNIQFEPVDDVESGEWEECSPTTISGFSAVGYFFGRHIHTETGVPIGLLNTSWGEMELPALWESAGLDGLDGVVWFRKVFELDEKTAGQDIILELGPIDDSDISWVNGHRVGEMKNSYSQPRSYRVPAEYLKAGKNVITVRVEDTGGGGGLYGNPDQMKLISAESSINLAGKWNFKVSPVDLIMNVRNFVGPNSNPTLLYNGMIHPYINFTVRGAIWYQGESNAGRAYQYRTIFPLLITDWREKWNNPDMPFFFVQLANYRQAEDQPGES